VAGSVQKVNSSREALCFEVQMMVAEKVYNAPQISADDYKKYSGKNVAIYKGKIVAEGKTSSEALNKALKKHPEAKTEDIEIDYIQLADVMIL
jgi:hypothetical protein